MPDSIWCFFAQWNEFIIYYDANGAHVYPGYVKTPTFAVYGSSNTVQKYKQMKHRKGERLKVIVSTESNWTNGVIRANRHITNRLV